MPVNPITGKEYSYDAKGYQDFKKDLDKMNVSTSPDTIMRYGGACPKQMPKYSNNPRTIQGRKLRRGGCVKMMKGGSIK